MAAALANPNLLVVGAIHALTAGAFVVVGEKLRTRPVSAAEQAPNAAAVTWWWGMAAYMCLQGTLTLAGGMGALSAAATQASRIVAGPVLALASWGLSFHILYLFSGWRFSAWPLGAYYAAAGALYSLAAVQHPVVAVQATAWEVAQTQAPAWTGPGRSVVLAMVGLPLVLSSLGYLTLAGRVETRQQRYRVLMVGTGILTWVVAGFAGQLGGGPFTRFATVVALGLLVSVLVFLAYFPPRPVRQWLG